MGVMHQGSLSVIFLKVHILPSELRKKTILYGARSLISRDLQLLTQNISPSPRLRSLSFNNILYLLIQLAVFPPFRNI